VLALLAAASLSAAHATWDAVLPSTSNPSNLNKRKIQ
jgi:hypothetical protein